MSEQYFRVRLTASAKDDLRRLGKRYGRKTYETVRDLIQDLEFEPGQKGEPLRGALRGFYSRHYSRFRIIYRIDGTEFVVLVVGAGYHESGSRNDIYKAIEKMLGSGKLQIRRESEADPSGEGD